jgi:adenine deaminase
MRIVKDVVGEKRKRRCRLSVVSALLRVAAASVSAQDILIRDATILTITHGKIEHGSILVRGGKIAAVGANDQVTAPANATVIDAAC